VFDVKVGNYPFFVETHGAEASRAFVATVDSELRRLGDIHDAEAVALGVRRMM
jgi:hypothetical protein